MSILELKKSKNKKGNTGVIVYCGNYRTFVPTGIGKRAMQDNLELAMEIDWVADDRKKLYIFLKLMKGELINEILNKMLAGKHLTDNDYTNTLVV